MIGLARRVALVALSLTGLLTLAACTGHADDSLDTFEQLNDVGPGHALWQGDAADCLSSGPLNEDDPNVAQTLELAMPEDEFWRLIDLLGGGNAEEDYERLTTELATLSIDQLVAFDARLTLAMYALDDQCHLIAFRDSDRWDGGWVNGDAFVYARLDTISAGRAAWDEALRSGTLPAGDTIPMDGELLLYVTLDASRLLGMGEYELWDLEYEQFSLSLESGSNPAGWENGTDSFLIHPGQLP